MARKIIASQNFGLAYLQINEIVIKFVLKKQSQLRPFFQYKLNI